MSLSPYSILGFWGPRRETPEALALRFNRLIGQLRFLHPAFGDWIWNGDNEAPIPLTAVRDHLAEEIGAAITRHEDGDPDPIRGFRFGVLNSLNTTPQSLTLSIHAGSWLKNNYYSNTAEIETGYSIEPDPTIVAYQTFRSALIELAEAFDMTFCAAFPDDLMRFWPRGPKFRFGWMNYVSPRFAPLITPPQSAIVEYRPNGGLLMSATTETFVTANPQHLAIAREIEAALAPLNALPWPPDAEPKAESANT